MKKLLALLLAVVMVLGMLAGCGKKDDKTNNKETSGNDATTQQTEGNESTGAPTEPKAEQNFGVAVGTQLDAPEKVFNTEGLTTFYVSFERKVENKMQTTEISVAEAEDGTSLIFVVNGPSKNKEAIYTIAEIPGEGDAETQIEIKKYIKDSGNKPYKLDEKTTAEDVAAELATVSTYIMTFTGYQEAFPGIKYRKAADVTVSCPTGPVYIYDVIVDGKVAGQVCIDKETGLLVKAKDLANTQNVAVLDFSTAEVEIPAIATDAPADGETPAEGETPNTETQA